LEENFWNSKVPRRKDQVGFGHFPGFGPKEILFKILQTGFLTRLEERTFWDSKVSRREGPGFGIFGPFPGGFGPKEIPFENSSKQGFFKRFGEETFLGKFPKGFPGRENPGWNFWVQFSPGGFWEHPREIPFSIFLPKAKAFF